MSILELMSALGRSARASSKELARASTAQKNAALAALLQQLKADQSSIMAANQHDVDQAQAAQLHDAMIDRLTLTPARFASMLQGIQQVMDLPDPIGSVTDMTYRPSGIQVGKMRVPLGVVGMIYESRPNVTIEAASLCIKSGNACILRGGSESMHTNQALASPMGHALQHAGLPIECVHIVPTTDRDAVGQMVRMPEYIDVIIPRGGKGLIERISKDARVPVIKHLDGICHVYIHHQANLNMAFDIALNAKTHRYGVCNAMETLLVDAAIATRALPPILTSMHEKGVELRGCLRTHSLFPELTGLATDEDWSTEYLAPILSIKIVDGMDEAIQHIATYGSHHTDAIVTDDLPSAQRFLREVDSSSVMVNASTRFADGFEYGLGAEIGISTDKFHARGPVGLDGLTSLKWIVIGQGHVRGS